MSAGWWEAGKRVLEVGRAGVLGLLYPAACALCDGGTDGAALCSTCRQQLLATANDPVCPYCAAHIGPYALVDNRCALCQTDSFAFAKVLRLGRFEGSLAEACLKIKQPLFHRMGCALADLFWEMQGAQLRHEEIDRVVPIPLHWYRRLGRGYDQASLLATVLARHLQKPVTSALWRPVATARQTELTPTQRRQNVRGAFRIRGRPRLDRATVLLVDDILTTGATCHHAAKELLAAGAQRVLVAVIARGDHR